MPHGDLRLRCIIASDLRFRAAISESETHSFCGNSCGFLRIGNGGGKQGRGNQPPYGRYGPDTGFGIDPRSHMDMQNPAELSPKGKGSRYGISVSTPHRRYGHDCGRRFCGRRFPRLLFCSQLELFHLQLSFFCLQSVEVLLRHTFPL